MTAIIHRTSLKSLGAEPLALGSVRRDLMN